jgi:hypothetical protein
LTDPGALPSRRGLPPRPVRLLGGVIALAVLLAAVAIGNLLQPVACACTPPVPTPELPPSPVVGVVVAIDQVSLTQVNSFDVRTAEGTTVRLRVGVLDNATQFSLSHLATHMATGVPIRAFYRLVNGEPVVYHLEDAVPATASPAVT